MKILIIIIICLSGQVFADEVSKHEFGEMMDKAQATKPNENLSELLKGARMVPHLGKDGRVEGFKAVEVKEGSTFEKIGLKKGDVIKSVDGRPVENPSQAMELYSELKDSGNTSLQKSKDN